jgi:peptidoglycan/LPS O-acetylase OafA/YrhL
MAPDELEAEMEFLRRRYAAQRQHWLRWGFASLVVGVVLCTAVLIKVAMTGDNPPPAMDFIVLTYVFLGLVFITARRSITLPRLQQSMNTARPQERR